MKCSSHHAHSFAGVEGPRVLTLRAASVRKGSQDIRSFEVLCASEPRSCVKEEVDVLGSITLRTPLSGTFLQTLPDLVSPLKGHSLSPRSCPPTQSAPSERFGC